MTSSKANRLWAIVIGIGLALSPIHNSWLTRLVTQNDTVEFFLPAFGTALWLMGALAFVVNNWEQLDWGDRKLTIPLLLIVASIGLSGFIYGVRWQDKIAPLLMGLSLFAVYIVTRKLGKDIFFALVPFVILGVVVSIINGILHPGQPGGGLITNYLASAGYLIFGTVVNQGKRQWILFSLMTIGLFFIGALEAVFIMVVIGIAVIIRRDINRRSFIAVGPLVILVGIWAAAGYLMPLYEGNDNLSALYGLTTGAASLTPETLKVLTTGRWEVIVSALQHIKLFGHGYSLSTVEWGTVHNIPIIILHQIGPVAAVAWTFVTVYCLIKTKWKYAWLAVIAMGVFDHYIWTQFVPFWWALIGVSTASTITSDRIFRTQ